MDFESLVELGLARPSPRGRGAPLRVWHVRDLGEGDVEQLLSPAPLGRTASPIKALRNSHHMLARVLAEGMPVGEAALMTGYTTARIRMLQADPTFQDLVAYYETQVEAKYLNVHERLATLGLSTLDELQERLEADPEDFSNRELIELAEFALDRSVTKDSRKGGGAMGAGPPAVAITFVNAQGTAQPQPQPLGHSRPPEGGRGEAQSFPIITIDAEPPEPSDA